MKSSCNEHLQLKEIPSIHGSKHTIHSNNIYRVCNNINHREAQNQNDCLGH